MKNLVLGLAINYGISEIKKFVQSFRKFNDTDDVVLLINCFKNPEVQDYLDTYNIKTLTYDTYNASDTRLNNVRFLKYLEVLIDDREHEQILISDIRDVVFQGNPFNNLPDQFLYLFKEDPGVPIGKCQYNSYWVDCAYSNSIAEHLADKNIICAGTILGSKNKIIDLLFKIRHELFDIKHKDFYTYQNVNIDQAILNKLCYLDQALDVVTKTNGDIIGTVGISLTVTEALDVITISNNAVLVNGITPSVIHQYDRHQTLVDFFERMY
jgi:hypothetical protein